MKALPNPVTDAPKLEKPDESLCEQCGGMCCSFKTMTISYTVVDDKDAPLEIEERIRETIRKSNNLSRQSGKTVNMKWYTDGHRLWFDCQHLTDEGRCGIYDDRPELCRAFECAPMRGEMTLSEYKDTCELEPNERNEADYLTSIEDLTDVTKIVTDELSRQENN